MDTDKRLSEAVRGADWDTARHLAAIRVAEAMERTESARDTKALALSLDQLIDKCQAARVGAPEAGETPLAEILASAAKLAHDGPAHDGPARDGLTRDGLTRDGQAPGR